MKGRLLSAITPSRRRAIPKASSQPQLGRKISTSDGVTFSDPWIVWMLMATPEAWLLKNDLVVVPSAHPSGERPHGFLLIPVDEQDVCQAGDSQQLLDVSGHLAQDQPSPGRPDLAHQRDQLTEGRAGE